MDFVFWIIVTVLLVGIVWWLLNRGNSPKAGASGDGAPTTTDESPERPDAAVRPESEGAWETQWSETSSSAKAAAVTSATDEHTPVGDTPSADAPSASSPAAVHHAEYTEAHSPTLPGAETAAAEAADEPLQPLPPVASAGVSPAPAALPGDAGDTETRERTESSAAVETAASHSTQLPASEAAHEPPAEPVGLLTAEEPYGAGSASPAPDGSGPEDFSVKGDAGAMVYYEEGHPDYEEARAGVWFESAAHAEAAGFRAPRRQRL